MELIAAMPPETESVVLWDFGRLSEDTSVLKEFVQQWLTGLRDVPTYRNRDDLRNVVLKCIAASDPVTNAMGGSRFARPAKPDGEPIGTGGGDYVERSIWVTHKPICLDTLLAARKDVRQGCASGVMVYWAEVDFYPSEELDPIRKPFLVATPNPHTVVWAESRTEIEYMIRSITTRTTKVPRQWSKVLDGFDVDAPVLVLRKYDPTNERDIYSPVSPSRPVGCRVAVEASALAVLAPAAPVFRMRMITDDPGGAEQFMQAMLFSPASFRWVVTSNVDGFTAMVFPQADEQRRLGEELPLFVLMFFGMNLLI
jgi:hypothetical protein